MIKYAELEGYLNLGEFEMFSHLYRFFGVCSDDPVMIFIHAYDIFPAQVFKGRVHTETMSYKNIDITEEENKILSKFVGDFKQVDWQQLAKGHKLLVEFEDFTEPCVSCDEFAMIVLNTRLPHERWNFCPMCGRSLT